MIDAKYVGGQWAAEVSLQIKTLRQRIVDVKDRAVFDLLLLIPCGNIKHSYPASVRDQFTNLGVQGLQYDIHSHLFLAGVDSLVIMVKFWDSWPAMVLFSSNIFPYK